MKIQKVGTGVPRNAPFPINGYLEFTTEGDNDTERLMSFLWNSVSKHEQEKVKLMTLVQADRLPKLLISAESSELFDETCANIREVFEKTS